MTSESDLPSSGDDEQVQRFLYHPFDHRPVTDDRCFLCGVDLNDDNRTREHVFPRWLQERFGIRDKTLTLLNGTSIPYRQLIIPACSQCNSVHLSGIENKMKSAIEGGWESVKALDELVIFQWLAKIFYGILRKEVFLKAERSSTDDETILPSRVFDDFNILQSFLQSFRFRTEFPTGVPWSIFRFRSHAYPAPLDFDFVDSFAGMCVAVRMNDSVIVACLQDQNEHYQRGIEFYQQFTELPLHYIQFKELAARVFYQQLLLNRVPKYMFMIPQDERATMSLVCLPLQGFSTKPIYDDFDFGMYAHVLSRYTGFPVDALYRAPDHVVSWLTRDDAKSIAMDRDDHP